MALTFTDKAAEEMESRVDQLVPYGYIDVLISTFHAFGDRILRDHAIDLGLLPDYRVLSLPEQLVFLREYLFELPLKYYKSLSDPTRHLKSLLNVISRAQDEDISPEEYMRRVKKGKEGKEERKKQLEVAKIYKKYQQLKAAKGFIDFSDQVGLVLRLLRENPAILKQLQQRYKYILIDEFQDTNYSQFELLKLLAGKKANLTVVGDDDQSIYRFRGAAISNILNFSKVYKKCKKVVLTENYRSTQIILDAARCLIKHNDPDRLEVIAGIDKRLKSHSKAKNKKVLYRYFDRLSSEADWVAQTIKKKYEQGYKYTDFAILVRANADAEIFRQSLNMAGIPHQFSGSGGLYVYPEVKFLISFLRVIGDLADSVSLYALASFGIYPLDALDLQKMNTFAKRRNLTLHHVFAHLEDGGSDFEVLSDLAKESFAVVRNIMDDIKFYLEFAKNRTTGEVLYKFLKRSGYLLKLTREESTANERRLQNIAAFFARVREFTDVVGIDRVSEFVKYLNILKDAGDNPESAQVDMDADAVNVLTVHKSKGLEFRSVFLVSLVADKFPSRSRKEAIPLLASLNKEASNEGDFHLQEERRLFFVGMTRAKEELFLTSAADYGGKRKRNVSRFVLEALGVPSVAVNMARKMPREQIELFAPVEIDVPVLKKLKKDEKLYLSFYQIDDYLTCPQKYKYVHVLRVPLLPNHQIIYGAALHKAVQAYNTAVLHGQVLSPKDLLKVLDHNWSSEGFISREHEEQKKTAARQALNLFCKRQKLSKRKIKYVEESFSVSKGDIVLRGRWDRVDVVNKNIHVLDFKSSEVARQENADRRAKASLQLSIYALGWKEKSNKLPHRLELYFLESGLIGSSERSEKDMAKTWKKIERVAEEIRQVNFAAKPSLRACSYCAYNEICPVSAV